MDFRRLELLLALSRLGSMRAVADSFQLTTSSVSQQLAALARETGVDLIEPDGRRVRLTPAGRRLAEHAVSILAAVDTARHDLSGDAEPAGTVRVGGFATGIRVGLLPALEQLAYGASGVNVVISEYEPREACALLLDDQLDLGLIYDYNLAPASLHVLLVRQALWSAPWGIAVPTSAVTNESLPMSALAQFSDHSWIVNSRNTADEEAVRTLAALAGFTPDITHQIDSLDLVEDLVYAGYGVALLPVDRRPRDGVTVVPVTDPGIMFTAYAVTRRGREMWAPLRAVLTLLHGNGAASRLVQWPRNTAP